MIVETSRPSRASRLRRPRVPWLPVLAVAMAVVGFGAAVLMVMHW